MVRKTNEIELKEDKQLYAKTKRNITRGSSLLR